MEGVIPLIEAHYPKGEGGRPSYLLMAMLRVHLMQNWFGYPFGGERICDNQQVRTDRLDELVWQQVVALHAHPDRLKTECERRLDVLEQTDRENPDTAALERQKHHLEKGKSAH